MNNKSILSISVILAGMSISLLVLVNCEEESPSSPEEGGEGIYYVSISGDDNNDGLERDGAFRTIGRAVEIVLPGDTIMILPGVYSEGISLNNYGATEQPITIMGEDNGVVLDGNRSMEIGFWCEGCMNMIFDNLEIANYTDIGIGFYQSSDIVLQNLVVHNNGFAVQLTDWELEGYGIHIDDCIRVDVQTSVVYANGPDPRPPGMLGTGINTYDCVDCNIKYNNTYQNVGGGILVEDGVNILVEGNNVTANYLDATEDGWWDGGIWVDGGRNVTLKNNNVQANIGPGIQISDEDNQNPFGYVLEGNICTGNYYGLFIWNFGYSGYPPERILQMENNQISGNSIQDVWIIP